jgi:Protein of unknown function (DUF3631)
MLPLPIMHRSIVIHMERSARQLRRFDENDRAVNHAYAMNRACVREVKLNPDPDLPDELRNRPRDNWRALVSVADSFGPLWGDRARKAAVDFSRSYRDEDAAVTLLNDIRAVFDALGIDRISSERLVEELVAMEDTGWADWRGVRDDQQPRRLSQGERTIAGAIRNPAAINLATSAKPRLQKSKGLSAFGLHESMACVLPFDRHTGTGQGIRQVASRLKRHKIQNRDGVPAQTLKGAIT